MENRAHVEPSELSYQLLKQITNNFDNERILGRGEFGTVYKGVHENGAEIAVKLLHNFHGGLDTYEFKKEFKSLRELNHPNIVKLVGFCDDTEMEIAMFEGKQVEATRFHSALCFEYVQHGSLNKVISDEKTGLTWHARYKIIKGICEGLKYLREGLEYPIMHFDLKPDNILLDKSMVPKIVDVGLSRLFGEENTRKTMTSMGSIGYFPPEYIKHQIMSKEFDIFSLGVIIVKIMTGHRGYNSTIEMTTRKAVSLVHERWKKKLRETLSHTSLEVNCNQVKRCIEIALNCLMSNWQERPTIQSIVSSLNETEKMIKSEQAHHEPNKLRYQLIKGITNDFHEDRILGRGAFGTVYKGVHENKEEIAVKVLHKTTDLDDKEFQKEFDNLRMLKHENIVKLVGYCSEEEEELLPYQGKQTPVVRIHLALCFEYVHNGSLEKYISDERMQCDWDTRYKIITGICEGLKYLHEKLIVHCDLKPGNILLDRDNMVKIADFGLAKFFGAENTIKTMSSLGTRGYQPREFIDHQIISREFDIYSLGVIIVKIMIGHKGFNSGLGTITPNSVTLVHESWMNKLRGTSYYKLYGSQVKRCIEIAIDCLKTNRHERPTIEKIVSRLNEQYYQDDGASTHPSRTASITIDSGPSSGCGEATTDIHTDNLWVVEPMVYMTPQHGSYLDHYISDVSSGLDWRTRYRIIKGVSEGVIYIHEGLDSPNIHMNLKTNNILLDENMVPRLGDSGMPRFTGEENDTKIVRTMGTIEHMPPEFIEKQVISKEFDIYSLGIIIIKVMTGEQLYSKLFDMSSKEFIELAHGKWRGKLQKTVNAMSVEGYYQQVKKCLEIAFKCVEHARNKRPAIRDIIHMLNQTETLTPPEQIDLDSRDLELPTEAHHMELQIDVQPLELCFRFMSSLKLPRKNVSCLLQLNNRGNDRVAFMLVASNPKKYLTKKPICRVVPPRSAYTLTLIMPKQPLSSDEDNFFTLHSVAVGEYDLNDVDRGSSIANDYELFFKGAEEVQEVMLKVMCYQEVDDQGTSSSEPMPPTVDIITTPEAQQVLSIDVHPEEPLIMTTDHVGNLRIWDYQTMTPLNSFQLVTNERVHAAKFITRVKWLVAGDRNGGIHVYNYDQNQHIKRFDAHDSRITTLAVHPRHPYILSSSSEDDDHRIKLWDWAKDWNCTRTFKGHTGRVTQVIFNPENEDSFASSSWDGTVKIWSIRSADPKIVLTLKSREYAVESLLCVDYFIRNDRQHLIIGSKDKTAKICKLGMDGCVYELKGHADRITAVNLLPNLPILITGSLDGTVCIWDSTTYKLENTITFNLGAVYAFGCIKGSTRIVVGCDQGIATMEISSS